MLEVAAVLLLVIVSGWAVVAWRSHPARIGRGPADLAAPPAVLAGPGRRLGARLVDLVLVYGPGTALLILLATGEGWSTSGRPELALVLAVLSVAIAYELGFVAILGWTVGKRLFGLRVVGPDGRPPGWAGAWLRLATLSPALLATPVCGVGVVRRHRRGAHDRVAGTVVVRGQVPPGWSWPVAEEPDRPRFRGGDAFAAVFAGTWTSALASLVAVVAGIEEGPASLFVLSAPFQLAGSALTVWAVSVRKGTGSFGADFGLRVRLKDAAYLLLGPALSVADGVFFAPLMLLLGQGDEPSQEVVQALAEVKTPVVMILAGLGTVVVGPVMEEVIFRGMFLNVLLRRYSERGAVFLSAGAFAAVHLQDPLAWPVLPSLTVLGYVLARLTLAAKNLSPAILTHAGFNLIVFVVTFTAE